MKHYGDIISDALFTDFAGELKADKLSEFLEAFKETKKKTREVMREGLHEWQNVLFPSGLSVEEAAFRICAVRKITDSFEAAIKESGGPAADTAEAFMRFIKSEGDYIKFGFEITPVTHKAVESESEAEATREEDDDE